MIGRSPLDSVAVLQVIDLLWSRVANPPILDILRGRFPLLSHAFVFPPLRTVAGAVFATGPDGVCLFISAGVNSSTGPIFASGYSDVDRMRSSVGFNYESYADVIDSIGRRVLNTLPPTPTLHLYGHSAGGVLAEALARYVRNRSTVAIPLITTYGAPKPGFPGACLEEFSTERWRVMAAGDAVPFVPSGAAAGPLPIALMMRAALPHLPRIIHGSGGCVLYPDGRIAPRADALSALPFEDVAIGSWLAGNVIGQYGAHTAAVYRQRLQATSLLRSPPDLAYTSPPTLPGPDLPLAVVDTVRGLSRVSAPPTFVAVEPNLVLPLVLRAPPAPLSGVTPMPDAIVSPRLRARVVRDGVVYNVVFMGKVIASSAFPSKSKTFASSFNRLCRRMGNVASVSFPAITEALDDFLGVAGIPGGGVIPPINLVG